MSSSNNSIASGEASGRSLRDASVRKVPARFAESELEISTGSKVQTEELPFKKAIAPVSGGAAQPNSRGKSPVTPGPPSGYQQPAPKKSHPSKTSTVAPSVTHRTSATVTKKNATAAASPPLGQNMFSASEKNHSAALTSEETSDPLPPPSAQRPRPRILVPDSSTAVAKPAESSTYRSLPQAPDVDFFIRRTVVRDSGSTSPLDKTDSGYDSDHEIKSQQSEKQNQCEEEPSVPIPVYDLTHSSPSSVESAAVANLPTTSNKRSKLPVQNKSPSKIKTKNKKTKGKPDAEVEVDERQPTISQSFKTGLPLSPEAILKPSKAGWNKAHTEEKERATAESAGLPYTPPKNAASRYYLHYNEPYLKQHSEKGRDEVGIAFDCLCCPEAPYTAWKTLLDSSTSLLRSHVGTKKAKGNIGTSQGKNGAPGLLDRYLIKKTSKEADEEFTKMDARHNAVGWVTEEARPISILNDKWFHRMLPKSRRDLVPHRSTTAEDIGSMYKAMQKLIRSRLASVDGCIHLALDIWTSPNGHSYLGVIGCWQEEGKAQRHVLDMVTITQRHTANNIAASVTSLIQRLGVEDKVWFITSDSASTNTAAMKILGRNSALPRVEGESTQIRCIAHIMNLISEAILRPFNRAVRDVGTSEEADEAEWESDEEVVERDNSDVDDDEINAADQEDDRAFSANLHASATHDTEDESLIRRALAIKRVAYTQDTLPSSKASNPPVPTEALRADSAAVGLQIRQLAWFARKLRYNTRLRDSFQDTCALFKLPRPYSLIRDVATRWNSTYEMIERGLILFDAITTWQ
ncbi:hypothetical protein CF326_g6850 [Tilletia indica]|nr:hypothetical protein CF326_g6850 [Tilletia indica]